MTYKTSLRKEKIQERNAISKKEMVLAEVSMNDPCDLSMEYNYDGLYENGNTEGFTIVDWRIENTCMYVTAAAMGVDGTTWDPRPPLCTEFCQESIWIPPGP